MQSHTEKDHPEEVIQQNKKKSLRPADMILAAILGVIVIIMFAQVFFRYVLNNSLSWSEEIVRFLFIWLTFLGAALNIRDKWHIGVDFFITLLPKRWSHKVLLFDLIIMLIFLLFLVGGGFVWVYYAEGAYSSALGLPLHIILYGALPVTSVLGCYYTIRRIRKKIHENNGGEGI